MNHPKLKYPRLCRLLPYILVLGGFAVPIVVSMLLPLADGVKVIVLIASLLGLLWYLIRNFVVLMTLDIALAMLSCQSTARTQYTLPAGRTAETIRQSILRYGKGCDPVALQPQPAALRYRLSSPLTVDSRGIERVIAAYEVDYLDRELYRRILSSAKTNSSALEGLKKPIFLDKVQKKQPLHRVTVVPILAHSVDPQMMPGLYELVNKQSGDEMENCVIPCVVDLAQGTCVFNCLRMPYVGFGYPVKNRGIRIVKNRIFGGKLNLRGNPHLIRQMQEADPEKSLWEFWGEIRSQAGNSRKRERQMVEAMEHREIRVEKRELYLKWGDKCICQYVDEDPENKTVQVESVTMWTYPKTQPIAKNTIKELENCIVSYYQKQGYRVEFLNPEET